MQTMTAETIQMLEEASALMFLALRRNAAPAASREAGAAEYDSWSRRSAGDAEYESWLRG